ncbi:MAG: C45 family autoproteolytic acyltransferase/hydrolase [Bacteroidota bacterium]
MRLSKTYPRATKLVLRTLIIVSVIIISFGIYFYFAVRLQPPAIEDVHALPQERTRVGKDSYTCGNNWLRKNSRGLWELYVEGEPYERGRAIGILSKELIYRQEKAFVDRIHEMIPSRMYLFGLGLIVAWFNRNLDQSIPPEYLQEIYGVSQFASHEFDDIGSNYQRILNYHGAHDIGHALQGMHMVGCTSFSVRDTASADGSLLVGRNFDFYVGDEFAKEKIVCFVNPTSGHKFMMVTWGGMIGAVSGMNESGLTVTINAAKSDNPTSAATPISIIAREILQYATTIKEAFTIAQRRRSFVSESILIGSLKDNRTAIIEKSPTRTVLFEPEGPSVICSNHFQSADFKKYETAADTGIANSSHYRYKRMQELLSRYPKMSALDVAEVLRDRLGLADRDIGMGNEKAVNQLIAHHSIIFNPAKRLVWVSTNPFQLGEYLAYDLADIFSPSKPLPPNGNINREALTIPPDPFLSSAEYQNFLRYKAIKRKINSILQSDENQRLGAGQITSFVESNPEYFEMHSLLGEYYEKIGDVRSALASYTRALEKEIPSPAEAAAIRAHIADCRKKLDR